MAIPATGSAALTFLGIAAGDASTNDAVLWTRAVDNSAPATATLTLQIATDAGFANLVQSSAGMTNATRDYSLKLNAVGLQAGTRYYYRFTGSANETSNVGTFKTAPNPTANAPLSFAFSGDCDGLIRPYALASQVPNKNLDFFMFDGDTIYETSAPIGSPAVTNTGTIPAPSATGATQAQLITDFSRKYREQFLPVNTGGQNALQTFYSGQGNYTMLDNHELGNRQYINGGAPAGSMVGDMPTGAGVDARVPANDTNTSAADYMNRAVGFRTLIDTYLNHQPVKDNRGTGVGGLISAPGDPRSDGTRQLYFAQQWGRNSIFINVDDRTYRDIRMKTASNADDTGARADNPNRTMLGATQLTWLEQTLLAAQNAGTTWKFINISDPIDQIGPIGGDLTLVNAPTQSEYGMLGSITSLVTTTGSNNSKTVTVGSTVGLVAGQPVSGAGIPVNTTIAGINSDGVTFTINNFSTIPSGTMLTLSSAPSTYGPVTNDGGKSWMGGYRAERNALLKFIADHQITNVVFLATDDHQNRINELTYSPTGQTGVQSTYVKVPYCFAIVCGPLGATGPDLISNHSFSLSQKLASSIANAQAAAGLETIGLAAYPGLKNVTRIGDPNAVNSPTAVDFYSPDTFNYNKLDVSQDGATLTVTSYGINSTTTNSFLEYDAANNPEKAIFSFQVDAAVSVCHKRSVTLTFASGTLELKRHLDHGDFIGQCAAGGGQLFEREN